MTKLSVIVPVYNESSTILEIINRVRNVNIGFEKEIIVIDGNSNDGTREKLKQEELKPDTKIIYETKRKGKGAAVKKGLEIITGDIIIIQDADLEVNPEEYPALLKYIISNEYEVVFGSRFLKKESRFRFMSLIANKIIVFITNLLYNVSMTDVLTCHKVFKKSVLEKIKLKCNGFDFDTEIVLKILKKGIKIREIPIKYSPRTLGEGKKIRWKDGFISIWTLIKYRFSNDD